MGQPGGHELQSVLQSLRQCGIHHEVMSANEANSRIPQFNLPHHYQCVIEEDGGILEANTALKVAQVMHVVYK